MIKHFRSCHRCGKIFSAPYREWLCEDCLKALRWEPTHKTNADHIRSMSDEELAGLLQDCCRGATHDAHECSEISCFDCRMDWLRKPYKEE